MTDAIFTLPYPVCNNMIEIADVKLYGKYTATRITCDTSYKPDFCDHIRKNKNVFAVSECYYKYAPEIKHTVIYVVSDYMRRKMKKDKAGETA